LTAKTPPSRRAKIADVAREAQTSTSTTSRALTGRGYVAEAVKQRILAAAQRLHYVPDQNARSLKRQRGASIGVIISDLENGFYAEIASGIEEEIRSHGYNILLANSDGDEARECRAIDQFREMRTPGIILTPVSAAYRERLAGESVPVVEVDRRMSKPSTDVVLLDNVSGAGMATEHLLSLGHRRIGVLCGERQWTTGRERLSGYRRALGEAGVEFDPTLVAYSTFHPKEASEAARGLLERRPDLTAIFAMNNVLTVGAIKALRGRRTIPKDVSLVGFDDLPWMELTQPALTTVRQDTHMMGRTAAEILLRRMAGEDIKVRTVRLAPALLVRESTDRPHPGT
jgi:LacI family transcriptional regulator